MNPTTWTQRNRKQVFFPIASFQNTLAAAAAAVTATIANSQSITLRIQNNPGLGYGNHVDNRKSCRLILSFHE